MEQTTNPTGWRTPPVERLADALVRLDDPEDMLRFLRDLCSQSELVALAQRLEVARLVDRGIPYAKVSKEVGASTATVTRVAQWLKHGEGGYRLVLDREESAGAA